MNLILHADEIFLKGSNQPFFYRCLISSIKSLFPGIRAARIESGFWVENFKEEEMSRLALVPGIANFAAAEKCAGDNEEIKKTVDKFLSGLGNDVKNTSSFRISCERSYKKHPLSSAQIEKAIGEHVRLKTGWKVSLSNPDLNIHIAVGKKSAYIYGNAVEGAGGLPTGSSGKVLCLLSGGIDSPVAAYQMMCRGAEVGLVHFQNQTSVTAEAGQKIFDLAKILARYQPRVELFVVPFAALQKEVVMKVPSSHRMIVSRRLFYKISEEIAHKHGYQALVTGDSLGQVASQTLENMSVIYDASGMLKLAPLSGTNKKDIMRVSRRIGALDISSRPYEDCCSLFLAKHPAIKARLADVIKYENNINLAALDKKDIISYHISNN